VNPDNAGQVSQLMQAVSGELAQAYNRRKTRSGAFWEGRFDSTMVEDGTHLWNCIKYIDLNMVRAGVVQHPAEWKWTGYQELMGMRQRYRLLDLDRVVALSGFSDLDSFRSNYQAAIRMSLERKELNRDSIWTESLAVGSKSFVERLCPLIRNRRKLEYCAEGPLESTWVLREEFSPYKTVSVSKSASKAL
jgi:putative transposase